MKKLLAGTFAMFVIAFMPAKADIDFGITLQAGSYDTSGSEKEKNTAGDNEVTSKSVEETFQGASIYIEAVADNGFTLGLDYVPMDIDLGSGSRTDSDSGESTSDDDTGTRTASASIENLITVYTNVPLFGSNVYFLGGIHTADVITNETLQTSSYPDEELLGYQVGLGYRAGKFKAQVYYSDFGDIDINSDQNNGQKITADADATALTISYGF